MTTTKNTIKKIWHKATKPVLYGLAALTIAGAANANAQNVAVETTIKEDNGKACTLTRTRLKASSDIGSITYDFNRHDPDEAKLWINCLDKNNWKIGVLAQGAVNNSEATDTDIGVSGSKTIKNKNIEVFVGPTVQKDTKPAMFYQVILKDTDKKATLNLSLVDDRETTFKPEELDFRGYFSFQKGDWFAGAGTRQKGLETTRVYGAGGLKTENFGNFTYFNYDYEDKELEFTSKSALGNPGGLFQISCVNLWNEIKGPGMRDVSVPYFTSFASKGDLTGLVKAKISPESKDYKLMVGKDLGIAHIGAGVNYHKEDDKTQYSGLVHAVKSFNLGKLGKICMEGKYNSRENESSFYTKFSKSF